MLPRLSPDKPTGSRSLHRRCCACLTSAHTSLEGSKVTSPCAIERSSITRSRCTVAVHPRQDGFVLLGLLILCSLLLTLCIFATATARTEVQIAYNDMLHHQSLAAAEAGISHAFMLLQGGYTNGFNDELTGGGTGGSLTTLGNLAARDGGSYRFHNFGLAAADG